MGLEQMHTARAPTWSQLKSKVGFADNEVFLSEPSLAARRAVQGYERALTAASWCYEGWPLVCPVALFHHHRLATLAMACSARLRIQESPHEGLKHEAPTSCLI